ncbi:hypothetical protein SDC9_112723 [bioreactor metagenome]|uniref:Serpin domain-containing protein n=1 Tax=bioreactor metagenome TaxID=1076179 RepID=A0A645BK12_9ZZZZ
MINVEKDFLQTNADYYGASAYKSPFNNQTVDDINAWVKRNTAEMIDSIIDSINADSVMYLINALAFEAEWDKVYTKEDISDGSFTAFDGTKRSVKMMYSEESKYIETSSATGFIKNYKDGKYSFVALLPNEGINISDYISSLSGTDFLSAVKNAKDENVLAHMPKFSFDYTVEMNEALKALGIKDAFDGGKADFSKLGSSQAGNIFIGNVLHKTFISVDELGTKAGAVTKVEMSVECAPMGHEISLDRSFVYAIVDNTTGLPLFIGAVLDIAD